jgi:hypothetical protein
LILFVHPHEESLGIVVEDTTARGPVTVEAASLEEAVTLLEKEVIGDQLLLGGSIHAVKRVELAREVALEGVASGGNLLHDLVALLVGDARAERVVSEVTADANTGGVDKGGLLLREGRAVELVGVHVGDVLVLGAVLVVLLDDVVEELVEGGVGVHGASVAADARVNILGTGEDAGLEGDTSLVTLVVIRLPDILGEVLADERLAVSRELGPAGKILRGLEVRTALGTASGGVGDTSGRVATHG